MDKTREDEIIRIAAQRYRAWEAAHAARPWYIKAYDRVRNECGRLRFALRGK